jgi:TniQ
MTTPTGIDGEAPVIAHREIDIAAPLDTVWNLHTDVDAWSLEVTAAKLDGAFAPGNSFTWTSYDFTVTSTIYIVEDHSRTLWGGGRQVSGGDVRPVFYGLALTARSARAVQAATGLSAGVIAGMQLARFGATALDLRGLNLAAERSLQPIAQREWLLIHGSRACPACLAQDSAWPLWWRLGIAAACPIHGLVLLDRCLACGIGLRRGYAGAPRGLSRQARVDPRACGNYSGGRRCVQVLAELPAQQAAQASVHAQRRALHAAHGGPVMVAGMPVGPREWFAALRYLSAMIRFAGDGWPGPHGLPAGLAAAVAADSCRDGRRGGTPAALSTSPPTAALAAAVLTLAAPILGARSPQEGAVLARPLIEAVVARRRERRHNPLSRLPLPPCLAASLVGLSVTGSRVVQALPAARMAHGFVLSFRHIPQLLDPVSYRGLIAGQLPGTAATSCSVLRGW